MTSTRFVAERFIAAPAEVVYRCIADYRQHHRPGGFLPAVFSDFEVLRGGVGEGTTIRFKMHLGGRTSTSTSNITEPEPGRVLVESNDTVRTVFTVEPRGPGSLVRFDTVLTSGGIEGLLNKLFAPRLLRPLYAEELERLERYAQAQAAAPAGASSPPA